jgi:beta-lactamase class A
MALFKRKKDDEDDDDYEEVKEVVVKKRPKSKTFKDLKSSNKRKRKEPKKPWGKGERLLVLSVLVITIAASGVLAASSRHWKLPGLPRLEMPSLSVPGFGEKTIIIEGNKQNNVKAEESVSRFESETKPLSGIYGLYVVRLNDGSSYGVNELSEFQAASLIKLPVIAAMYQEAEDGNIDLDSVYTLKNADKVAGSGSLYSKPAGYKLTYQELLNLMGKESDNTAFNVCRKYLGDEKINAVIEQIGMVGTSLSDNTTTPLDIGVYFQKLWKGDIVSTVSRDKILDSLTDTIYENWLAAGIPDSVRVAHKFGREVHVVNDAGIVFADEPFVVVILSDGVVEHEVDEVFPQLSKIIYDVETGKQD